MLATCGKLVLRADRHQRLRRQEHRSRQKQTAKDGPCQLHVMILPLFVVLAKQFLLLNDQLLPAA
jgi:hypothetical protein